MGNIQTEITRIINAKAAIKTAIENKGGTVSGKIDTFAAAINGLSTSNNLIPTIGIGINGYYLNRIVPVIFSYNNYMYISYTDAKNNNKVPGKTDNGIYVSLYNDINKSDINKTFYYEDYKTLESNLFSLELLLLGDDSDGNPGNVIQRHIYTIVDEVGLSGDTFINTATLNDIVNLGTNCIVAILKNK